MQQPVAGPSVVRHGFEVNNGMQQGTQGMNPDVEMGENGHGQKPKCRDYHGESYTR